MTYQNQISNAQKRIALLELGYKTTQSKFYKLKYLSRIDFQYSRIQHFCEMLKANVSYQKRELKLN